MAGAARALLDSLDQHQLDAAAWRFPSDDERHRWFYTPTDHGGLPLSAMRPAQQRRTMQLVRVGAVGGRIRHRVDDHRARERARPHRGLEGVVGARAGRDPGLYYVRIFGDPEPGGTWSWRFGGHHVSINHTIVDGEVVGTTPCFLGADPAVVAAARSAPAASARRRPRTSAASSSGRSTTPSGLWPCCRPSRPWTS